MLHHFQFSIPVQCTNSEEIKRTLAPQPKSQKVVVGHDFNDQRQPRLIKELTMLNRQSCLSKIMCGVNVAQSPTSSSSTINDYAYVVKSLFDLLS